MEPKVRKQSREKENNSVLVSLFNSWIKPHLKPDLLHGRICSVSGQHPALRRVLRQGWGEWDARIQ